MKNELISRPAHEHPAPGTLDYVTFAVTEIFFVLSEHEELLKATEVEVDPKWWREPAIPTEVFEPRDNRPDPTSDPSRF